MKSSSTSDDASTSIYQEPIEIQFPSDLTSKVQSLSDQTAQLESKLLESFNQLNVPPLSYPSTASKLPVLLTSSVNSQAKSVEFNCPY